VRYVAFTFTAVFAPHCAPYGPVRTFWFAFAFVDSVCSRSRTRGYYYAPGFVTSSVPHALRCLPHLRAVCVATV